MAKNRPLARQTSAPRLFGTSPHNALSVPFSVALGIVLSTSLLSAAKAGDILRGGASARPGSSGVRNSESQVDIAAPRVSGNASDALARTTKAVDSVRAMQAAARQVATARPVIPIYQGKPLPAVPNGLRPGGLEVAPEVAAGNRLLWKGAQLPVQKNSPDGTRVVIRQTEQSAVLNWKTFNVSEGTTVQFDQRAGGERSSEWIAFNKINDPSGRPSQILGSIEAEGQVYLINRNGIIFGGSSMINLHTMVASSLPINDNLIQKGLLNNRDAQFLFSALPVPGGSDGTPAFNPTISDPEFRVSEALDTYVLKEQVALSGANLPLRSPQFTYKATDGTKSALVAGSDYTLAIDATTKTASAKFTAAGLAKIAGTEVKVTYTPVAVKTGDVVVQAGAVMKSPVSADGNGGRLMLVGTNVTNAGTLSAPAGQTILAAGQQVAIAAHASNDPSLRGLDVWVGATGAGGTVTNSGLIEAYKGSASMSGRYVNQLGAIDSSTSVDLNGRIDLQASYGAVANPNFDNTGGGAGGPPFLFQHTGVVTFGEGSTTRILPDYASDKTVPGTSLPERSQINVEGRVVHLGPDAVVLAPNGDVSIRAGLWPYQDLGGNRNTFYAPDPTKPDELSPEPGLQQFYSGPNQRFLFSGGQIYLDKSSLISVAGSVDVFVPLTHSILDVEFRGAELADSPLQRDGALRGISLTLDLRQTGAYGGRFWMGTPLGDATGLAGLIQRNVAQLTTEGGNVELQAGASIVVQSGATIDVSGGFFRHEGGMVKTTRLLQDGRLVDIADTLPDQLYDGIYTGEFTRASARWGVSETFATPWMNGERFEAGYVQGADGGSLSLKAPSMAIDGELRGQTIKGSRERTLAPEHSSVSFAFTAEKVFEVTASDRRFLAFSPTPPSVIFSEAPGDQTVPVFTMAGDEPAALAADRLANVFLSPKLLEEQGFGHLSVENTDGDITLPAGGTLAAPALGSITLAGANVAIRGDVIAPGGELAFVAHNISPAATAEFPLINPTGALSPLPNLGRGLFSLGAQASLNVAGLIVDDRPSARIPLGQPLVIDGGSVSIISYDADLSIGSKIDVSGGVAVGTRGSVSYGDGGSIEILTGRDPEVGTVLGGKLVLGSELAGYSGATGGSLALQAESIQIGGLASTANTLYLSPSFFRQGGFTNYEMVGIGALLSAAVEAIPAVEPGPNGEPGSPAVPGKPATYTPGITIAAGAIIEPVAESWRALPHELGEREVVLEPTLNPLGLREPASISFAALGADDVFTLEQLEVRGDIVMGAGAAIVTDPGASVGFDGDTVTMLGSITAPGGAITIEGASRFPLRGTNRANIQFAQPTVYVGPRAKLSTAGAAVVVPDEFGRRQGTLFAGGTISIEGNIVADAGAVFDVSGASTVFDVAPTVAGLVASPIISPNSGINAPLASLESVPARMDSDGGTIDLQGSEMLHSDATLLGHAGGPTAIGGTLSVFSGRFYLNDALRTSADINLVVKQHGDTIPQDYTTRGVGLQVGSETGIGYFTIDRFTAGGFHSLDLGAKFLENASPLVFGGNVEFRGPVSVFAPGTLRVAGGGVLQANAPVSLTGSYVSIGQPFRPPLNPDDLVSGPFSQTGGGLPNGDYNLAPTFGGGRLIVQAGFIDTGTLSLQGIGGAQLLAERGDIRGSGTINIAGNLSIRAGQLYPATASDFTIAAYDKTVLVASSVTGNPQVTLASAELPRGFRIGSPLLGSTVQNIDGATVTLASGAASTITSPSETPFAFGSVVIGASGSPSAPLSAGGRLSIYASRIVQEGTLRAPIGSIVLGWDGTDLDPSTALLNKPVDLVTGTKLAIPVTRQVTLGSGSLTSVAAIDYASGAEMLIPFGLSPDGLSWIDPRGQNVTVNSLPEKSISIAGGKVTMARGSTVDIRGGGDLYAYRWVPGEGGSTDLLGEATGVWNANGSYSPGDLVGFGGKTWSARVGHTGEQPTISLFWSLVPESYAILPGFSAPVAPFSPYNGTSNATSLGGDQGYVSSTLNIGDRIFLGDTPGLEAGSYTLLPRRYALLPGAFLVTPNSNEPIGTIPLLDGSVQVSGYQFNEVSRPTQLSGLQARFEVAPSEVLRSRVEYVDYSGNAFFSDAARRLDIDRAQRMPLDSGYLALHGNTGLRPDGRVLTARPEFGRGAAVDLSSFADIYVMGGNGSAPADATAVIRTGVLATWGVESLVIGGLRRETANGTSIEVRTSNLTLDNRGGVLSAPDITLASKAKVTLTAGSSIAVTGRVSEPADAWHITGAGALLRVSSDAGATVLRTGDVSSTAPLLTVGANVRISGPNVVVDSTYGTSLDSTAGFKAGTLTLGSGQISILLEEPAAGLTGSVVDQHLVISGDLLRDVQQVGGLTLRSYRTIDLYGEGSFGESLGHLSFLAGGIRGYEQGGESARMAAREVRFANPSRVSIAALPAPVTGPGAFQVDAKTVRFGNHAFSVGGFADVNLNASQRLIGKGTVREIAGIDYVPAFSTPGNLTITTPLITGSRGATQEVNAGGNLVLNDSEGAGKLRGGLGASYTFTSGGELVANTSILLPSGELTLRARTGNVTVGGKLNVTGVAKEFYDLTRYSDAGTINLTADQGDINLLARSSVSVAAPTGGGNAGSVTVKAPQGAFQANGADLSGAAGAGQRSGSFLLDAGSLPSFTGLSSALNDGGFFEQRNLRVRVGDVVIANVGSEANVARNFVVSADTGSIQVTGTIDASGATGGKIVLAAGGSLTLENGSVLTAHGEKFSNAGKGGEIRLEAGSAISGVPNLTAQLDVKSGSTIDLGVDGYKPGLYTAPGSSAFQGQFTGTLHLRAPRVGDSVNINALQGNVAGASSVLVEGYRIYDRTGVGTLNIALREQIHQDNTAFINAGYVGMEGKLLTGSTLDPNVLVIAPGVEIINTNGNLTLGLANNSSAGSTNVEARSTADWDLSGFRYGPKGAAGVLTLRASGDLVFNNTLSDGFTPIVASAQNGHSAMWLGQLKDINPVLPINTQSWSYRLGAGADLQAVDFRSVIQDAGSVVVGEFYPEVPNKLTSGSSAGVGADGLTANTIRVSTTLTSDRGTRYEVVRTGTGDIDIASGSNVQLRNQFSTIYTAGVRLPNETSIFSADDFVSPIVIKTSHPNQGGQLGAAVQQQYRPQWSMGGGDLTISAHGDIGRFTLRDGKVVADSSRQMPNNWLYRRGYVDGETGLFARGGVDAGLSATVDDPSASTTWWIDFSNFFQGFGALGGGDIELLAGEDLVNADAVIPTNARMPGRAQNNDGTFTNIAPDLGNLVELGGGDLFLRSEENIDGGIFYAERGQGILSAGRSITTNESRSPSLGILAADNLVSDPLTWLPTTLFVGKSQFDVSARGDVLLGPVTNSFLLPQGLINKFWYKTYFNSFSADASVSAASFGGSVTHRLAVTPKDGQQATPILAAWYDAQYLGLNVTNAAYHQPWIRSVESSFVPFSSVFTLTAPTVRSTAFAGDVNVVGSMILFPSSTGTLELAASGAVIGLNPSGSGLSPSQLPVVVWTAATVNVSDASPNSIPSVSSPLAHAELAGRVLQASRATSEQIYLGVDLTLKETGSFSGPNAAAEVQQALHASGPLHAGDQNPVRVYALGGDITGLTLFSSKAAQIAARDDIADVAFYIQNTSEEDVSFVSAGRDIVPFNESSPLRAIASDLSAGNLVGDPSRSTVTGAAIRAAQGDIQISGPGTLEVLAGRNLDLGTGPNFADGTGLGITSIGNSRNPFLPVRGADIIVLTGIFGSDGSGPALGLSQSSLDIAGFAGEYVAEFSSTDSAYLAKLGASGDLDQLTEEQQAVVGLETFFAILRDSGRAASAEGDYSAGFEAIEALFGRDTPDGEILTRARDIRTTSGGAISMLVPGGGITMASDIFGNPLTPPGIVSEFGGAISVFTNGSVEIGQARIFTLRGGDIVMWSSTGDIAAGNAPRTVATAPPTRVLIDTDSAAVQTDLGGLATGGGIGVLASVEGVPTGDVDLIAPVGSVDAGDAGIRVTGNINIAAAAVLNATSIQAGGSSTGVPAAAPSVAPVLASTAPPPPANTAPNPAEEEREKRREEAQEETPSIIVVEVIGYGGGEG